MCYIFNLGRESEIKIVDIVGVFFGFMLFFDVNIVEYICGKFFEGFKVLIYG